MPLNPLGELSSLTNLASGASDAISGAASSAVSSAVKSATSPLTNYVIIILGLLLVAAGIFSFDKMREIIVQTGKTAAAAAAA